MNIAIVGPSISRTKGGMATVISDMLSADLPGVRFFHIVSHVEGGAPEKISVQLKALSRLIRERGVDVVHIHVASGASFFRKSLFVLLARARGIPAILHVHGADFHEFFARTKAKGYVRRIFGLCSRVLVLSGFWKDYFARHILADRVEVLHNGVYARRFTGCFTAPERRRHFLFLGRLGQRKGAYDLIEAIDGLVNGEGRKDLYFYMAGDGEVAEVQELVNRRGLADNIRLPGWVGADEKQEWFGKVDTVLLPSYNEGLPMALLEAMAAGKLIISTRVGGIPDLVTEGSNGFLLEPGDVPALKRFILQAADDPEGLVRIARNNQEKIFREYDLDTLNRQLLGIYTDITSQPTKRTAK